MTTIAFWLIVGAGIAAFAYELYAVDLASPLGNCCHHCGQLWDELCDTASQAVGEPCCHACGKQIRDVDTAVPVCAHPHTATWRRK